MVKNRLTLGMLDKQFKKVAKYAQNPESFLTSPDVFYKMWKAKLLQMDEKLDRILKLLEKKKAKK